MIFDLRFVFHSIEEVTCVSVMQPWHFEVHENSLIAINNFSKIELFRTKLPQTCFYEVQAPLRFRKIVLIAVNNFSQLELLRTKLVTNLLL